MRYRCEGCGASLAREDIGGQGAVEELPGEPLFHLTLGHHPDCGTSSQWRCVELCPVVEMCGPVLTADEAFAERRTDGEPVG